MPGPPFIESADSSSLILDYDNLFLPFVVKYGYTVIYIGFASVLLGTVMIRDYDISWWQRIFS